MHLVRCFLACLIQYLIYSSSQVSTAKPTGSRNRYQDTPAAISSSLANSPHPPRNPTQSSQHEHNPFETDPSNPFAENFQSEDMDANPFSEEDKNPFRGESKDDLNPFGDAKDDYDKNLNPFGE